MEGYFIAQITIFAGNFAPLGWAYCNGSLLSIDQNAALFSLIGTFYGGDGQTTFGLPDFRGRIPIGAGQGPGLPNYTIGQMAGVPSTTVTTNQMPAHTHTATATIPATGSNASSNNPSSRIPAATNSSYYAASSVADGFLAGTTGTVNPTGGNVPLTLGMPVLGLNYVICLEGIYPSRN